MAVYSLTNYQLIVEIPDTMKKFLTYDESSKGLVFGGSGSYLESFEIDLTSDTWEVKGDYTGSWIHTMNGNRTGTCSVSLNQVSRNTKLLNTLVNLYYLKSDINGSFNNLLAFPTITLYNLQTNEAIVECTDCFLKRAPSRKYGTEAQNETWEFVCGQIIIKSN